jgi:putative tryptophan/tyrosine transport system substrate-binding protein
MPVRGMKRREFVAALGGAAAWPLVARAQQASKIYRIGIVSAGPVPPSKIQSAFFDGLRDLGWIEGKNIAFEQRYADNHLERLPDLAADLVHLHEDVIVAAGTLALLAAKRATASIPIVMTGAGDPLGSGLIASLARPSGNITGLNLMAPDLAGKRVEMLKELLPTLSQVAVIWNGANPYSAVVFKETQRTAQSLSINIRSIAVGDPSDLDGALDAAPGERLGALITVEDLLTLSLRRKIIDFAAAHHLPAMYGLREFAEVGGLIAYGADLSDLWRRAASDVSKILEGAQPFDVPVEPPTKFELVINLRTAKTLGLGIPPTLLARADEVIE